MTKYDPDKHHRRSIRLKDYDYAQAGVYFVTLCTHNRECLFGEVMNGKMALSEFGDIVREEFIPIEYIPTQCAPASTQTPVIGRVYRGIQICRDQTHQHKTRYPGRKRLATQLLRANRPR